MSAQGLAPPTSPFCWTRCQRLIGPPHSVPCLDPKRSLSLPSAGPDQPPSRYRPRDLATATRARSRHSFYSADHSSPSDSNTIASRAAATPERRVEPVCSRSCSCAGAGADGWIDWALGPPPLATAVPYTNSGGRQESGQGALRGAETGAREERGREGAEGKARCSSGPWKIVFRAL